MSSKVEIIGGQLDGSVLQNAASESTLRELIDAVKRQETAIKNTKQDTGSKQQSQTLNVNDANAAMKNMANDTDKSSKKTTSTFDKLGKMIGQASEGIGKLKGATTAFNSLLSSGNSSLSGFATALAYIPGPIGGFAKALVSVTATLDEYQKMQRQLSTVGASFNNSMMDMRIAAAESGVGLQEYANFVKSSSQEIAGLGDTITEGAQKLSALGKAVGESGLDQQFMKLGMSAQGARLAAMRFATELVKGDRVRSSSMRELASASLSYEKDLDLLAKQTGRSKDQLREFGDAAIKKSGAMLFAFAGMAPGVQASLKTIMNTVGATMGDGAATAMTDLISGAAAPTSEASAMFQAQVPGAVKAFKDMKDVANDTSLSEEQRRAKLDMLQAKAQAEQLKFLQTEQGKFMMQNKAKLSPAQREFVEGLEKNAASLSAQGIDINKASAADIEAAIAAKRAEQDRQAALDAGMNRFTGLITTIGSMLQTGFFKLVNQGFNIVFAAFDKLGTVLKPVIDVVKMTGDEFEMIAGRIGEAFDNVVMAFQPMIDIITGGFSLLGEILGPVTGLFTDYLMPAIQGVSDFIQDNLTPIVGAVVTVLGTMALMALPAIIGGLVAIGASMVTAAAAILAPFLPVILAVGLVAAGFMLLKRAGFDVQTAFEGIGDNLYKFMFLPFKEMFVNMLAFLPETLGGYSKEQEEAARQGLADEKAALASKAAARDATRAENIKQNEIAKAARKEENAKFREEKALGRAQQDAAQAKKDAIRDAESADAMERSKARAVKQMRELAGIEKPSAEPPAQPGSAKAPSPGMSSVVPGLQKELAAAGIVDPKAQANIMAQIEAESGGVAKSENLNYSGKKLFELYGAGNKGGNKARFKTVEEADAVAAKGPEAVGNVIYGSRMGNKEDEGYKYRGRGLIQLTGKNNYKKFGDMIGVDLVGNPDLANDPAIAQKLAVAYFSDKQKKGVNLSDINAIGKAVGYAGGAAETAKRSQLAQGYSTHLAGGVDAGLLPVARMASSNDMAERARSGKMGLKAQHEQAFKDAKATGSGGEEQDKTDATTKTLTTFDDAMRKVSAALQKAFIDTGVDFAGSEFGAYFGDGDTGDSAKTTATPAKAGKRYMVNDKPATKEQYEAHRKAMANSGPAALRSGGLKFNQDIDVQNTAREKAELKKQSIATPAKASETGYMVNDKPATKAQYEAQQKGMANDPRLKLGGLSFDDAKAVQGTVKPKSSGITVPASASATVAATTSRATDINTSQQKAIDESVAMKAERKKALETADTKTATTPAGTTMQDVIESLNTNIAMLTQLQVRAVSIAEQQLRATNSLSRDAYRAL